MPFVSILKAYHEKVGLLSLLHVRSFRALAFGEHAHLVFFQNSTNNLFQTSLAKADQISSFRAAWEKNFSPFSIFAEGGYSYLWRNTGLSFLSLNGGADYLQALSAKTALYLLFEGEGVLFRPDYADFNHTALRLSAAVKSYLHPTSIFKANAISEYRKYRYSLFDFVSQSLQITMDKFFESKTTLKAELSWGYKYFLHPVDVQSPAAGMTESGYSASGQGMTMGMGPVPGMGMGNSGGHGSYFISGPAQGGRGIQIASVTGLIAQGIGDDVGLRLMGTRQWTLSGENPFTSIVEFYGVENPTYDLFSWNGTSVNGLLTGEIPWDVEAKIGYTMSDKEFPGIESLGSTGTGMGATRKDKRRQFGVKLERKFSKISLFLAYSYIKNASNDAVFEWKGHSISGGLEWNLTFGKAK